MDRDERLRRIYLMENEGPNQNHNPVDKDEIRRLIAEMTRLELKRHERPIYRKPCPDHVDRMKLPQGFKVHSFTLFNAECNCASTLEHIGRFSTQCVAIENNPLLKLKLFGGS